jgi:flagellar biosynthesis protein FlhG
MPEAVHDQAAGLRRMSQPDPVSVIAVSSGKGGVGKTNVSVNLSVAMAKAGRRVMLMDADLGLANVDVMLGLQPRGNLSHVISGRMRMDEILCEGPAGIQVIPAASGVARMADLSAAEHAGLIRAFSDLHQPCDVLVVDTAAGVSDSVVSYLKAAHHVLVVVCDEPASITDAYALIKVLSRDHGLQRFHIVANMVSSSQHGKQLYAKLARVCDRFLDVILYYMGSVPFDEKLRLAIQRQRSVVDMLPGAPASQSFSRLARTAMSWPQPEGTHGKLEFFVERLVGHR